MGEDNTLNSEADDNDGEQGGITAEQALNDAAKRVNTVWISFVILCVYIFIATYTVTPAALFREAPVKIPIFNADLPLKVYFLLAPILILCLHAYLIVLAKGLTEKFDAYERHSHRSKILRARLDNSIIMRATSARYNDSFGFIDVASGVIAGLTLIVLPIWLLLLTQLMFLPHQSEWLTLAHRGFLVFDVALCFWLLWPFSRTTWPVIAGRLVAIALILFAATTSIFFATFPGEGIYSTLYEYCPQYEYCPHAVTIRFFEGPGDPVDYVHRGGVLPFSNRLILPDDPKLSGTADAASSSVTLAVRGRNFRKAVFDRSNLNGVDFSAADLTEASLRGAKLEGAKFECASPVFDQSAALAPKGYAEYNFWQEYTAYGLAEYIEHTDCTRLRRAELSGARLQHSSFRGAQLIGVNMRSAILDGALLSGAQMSGADLREASIQSANFSGSQLTGASFSFAKGSAADFSYASLTATDFNGAYLTAANFYSAMLQAARFAKATLIAAEFTDAHLQAANLSSAELIAASFVSGSSGPPRKILSDERSSSCDLGPRRIGWIIPCLKPCMKAERISGWR